MISSTRAYSKSGVRFGVEPKPKPQLSPPSNGGGKRTAVAEEWPMSPRPPHDAPPQKSGRSWLRVFAFLTAIYAGASLDKTSPIEQAVVHYPGIEPKVVQTGTRFFNPLGIATTQRFELRDQSAMMDIEGKTKDGKKMQLRMEVVWAFRHQPNHMQSADAKLTAIPKERKDELYLYNWSQGGPDANGVVYFADTLGPRLKQLGQQYVAAHDASEFTPENADKIAKELLTRGFDGQPSIADHVAKNFPELRIQAVVVSLGNGFGSHKDTW